MKLSAFFTILLLCVMTSGCQVKIPFLQDSKYSMRAPASVVGDNKLIVSGEYSEKELELALNYCHDLRALRFAWPFLKTNEKKSSFDKKHFGCDGSYQEKLNFESFFENSDLYFPELQTDEQGEIAKFCEKLLHGQEPVEDTEMLPNGSLVQRHFYITPEKKRAFSIIRSEPDGAGQFVIKEHEIFILSDSRDQKYRGMIVKRVRDKICPEDRDQGMERWEQILHD